MKLSENLISYSTVLNKQTMDLKKAELNLLFGAIYVLKNKEDVIIPYVFFKDICNDKSNNKELFKRNLEGLKKKLDNTDFVNCGIQELDNIKKLNIFKELTFDKDNNLIYLELNEGYTFLTNDLYSNIPTVSFDLGLFTSLQSKLTKNLYRILSGFNNTGWVKMEEDRLFNLLGIKNKREWDRRKAFDSAMIEISPYFKGLNYNINRNRIGENIIHIKFKASKNK